MKRLFPLFAVLLLAACAQVRELQGGEKDTVPPQLLSSEPPNGSLRFSDDRIVLRFDERIKLDRVRDRMLISPPLDRAPDVSVEGGTDVVIGLKAPLRANTTYTFNIGEAVVDITEGIPAAGLTYVISTGDVLDSLHVHGVLVNAFADKPETSALVILHADTDTAGFISGRPAYFTRTDEEGRFTLRHLREGRYRMYALRDQNGNFRFDLPNEQVAFTDTLIDPTDEVTHVLRMFLQRAPTQQILEAVVQPDRCWRMVLARPADHLALRTIDRTGGSLQWVPEWNGTRDTVLFWPSDTTLLAEQRFEVSDTSGVIDTLTYHAKRKMPFLLDVKAGGRMDDGRQVFMASRPVASVENDRVRMRIDSLERPVTLMMDTVLRRLILDPGPLPEGKVAALVLLPGAVRDIYAAANDTLRFSIGSRSEEQTGDLRLNLTADSSFSTPGPFILHMLNAQGGLVRSERFNALPYRKELPGTPAGVYHLKLIADQDGDGRWSTGSLPDGRQPELVLKQAGEVNVRAGWEVSVDWVVKDP